MATRQLTREKRVHSFYFVTFFFHFSFQIAVRLYRQAQRLTCDYGSQVSAWLSCGPKTIVDSVPSEAPFQSYQRPSLKCPYTTFKLSKPNLELIFPTRSETLLCPFHFKHFQIPQSPPYLGDIIIINLSSLL